MSLTDTGTGLAIAVAVGGLAILGCVAYAFRRTGRARRELGPWSVLLAYLSFQTGLYLIFYAMFVFGADSIPMFARGRNVFFTLFIAAAQGAILVLPLVLLQLPLSALFAIIPAVALLAVKLGEVFFFPSIIAVLTLPVVLVLEFIALRVAWGTGRLRKQDEPLDEQYRHRHEALPDDAKKQWAGPNEVRARRIEPYTDSPAMNLLAKGPATFGAIESGPGAVNAGAVTLVSVSSLAVAATVAESILLGMLGAGCNDAYLHAIMGIYAAVHGALSVGTLAPASTFA